MHVPSAGSSRVVLVRQSWAVLVAKAPVGTHGTIPALEPLAFSPQPFFLPAHGVLLCWPTAAHFQMLTDAFFSKA